MPRSTIASRREAGFDKNLELRDYGAAALSATGSSTPVLIPVTKQKEFNAILNVAAYTGTFAAGTLQWAIDIEACATVGGTYVSVAQVVPAGTATEFKVPLSGDWIESKVAGAKYIRVTATKTGAAGNLTYGGYLQPAL